jgi:RNA recognition motif-containing protein
MAKKLYVGNLNYDTTEDNLRGLFAVHGEVVNMNIIIDRYSGRSKGFGFIEMADDEAAQAAISALNGQEVEGRQLRVSEAHRKPRNFDQAR